MNRIDREIVACARCPRLRAHCEKVAREKRRAYRDWTYWGRPVPGFGDPAARVLVVGLAPAAHGANRTGRMFTGDSSGNWLYRALHEAGLATRPASERRGDGLALRGAYVSAAARCAPPGNRPTPAELARCRPFLEREWDLLAPRLRVVVPLGKIAFDACLAVLAARGAAIPRPLPRFAHGALVRFGDSTTRGERTGDGTRAGRAPVARPMPILLASYHPSRQNTQTGRLRWPAFREVFRRAARLSRDPR